MYTYSVASADLSALEAGELLARIGVEVYRFPVCVAGERVDPAAGDLVHQAGDVVYAFDGRVKAFSPAVDGVLAVLVWIAS